VKRATIICVIALALAVTAAAYAQDLDSLMATGDKLFEKGDYHGASLYYEEALYMVTAQAPEENLLIALIHMQLGRCYVMLNNDNTALINYHEALARAKREIVTDREKAARIIFGAYGSILDIYDRLGMTGPMLSVTDEFIAFIDDYRKSPLPEDVISSAQVNNSLAYCLAQRGERLDEALSLVESSLKAEPKNVTYLDTKGWVLLKMGKVGEAKKVLKDAVDLCMKGEDSCYIIERHLKIATGDMR
jgi:tetratricopeptide (TPR) repeat protein